MHRLLNTYDLIGELVDSVVEIPALEASGSDPLGLVARLDENANMVSNASSGAAETEVATSEGVLSPVTESRQGQDDVSDQELARQFAAPGAQREFLEALVRDYKRILHLEDIEGLLAFERDSIHFEGRFIPHFDPRGGDGPGLLRALDADIARAIRAAGDDVVARVRGAYAIYRDYASGERSARELILMAYLSEFLVLFRPKAPGGRGPRGGSVSLPPSNEPVIVRWTANRVHGGLKPTNGLLRVFTGQSGETLASMIRRLELRETVHIGRAQWGGGVYTSQQQPIAQAYAKQHGLSGKVGVAEPRVLDLQIVNFTDPQTMNHFRLYLRQTKGLETAYARVAENRFYIVEGYIGTYAPNADLVIAPHPPGNQLVFRSARALKALEASFRADGEPPP